MTIATMSYEQIGQFINEAIEKSDFKVDSGYSIEHTDCFSALKSILSDNGFQFLGAGFFSAAFSHDAFPNMAFKIGFKKEDSGAQYAAWCRNEWASGRGNVHIPKIEYLNRFKLCYVSIMPLYRPMSVAYPDCWNDDWDEPKGTIRFMAYNMERVLFGYLNSYLQYKEAVSSYPDSPAFQPFAAAMVSSELYLLLARLGQFFKGVASFDLHTENFMFDAEGNIVITDPVSFTLDEKKEALPSRFLL